MTADSIGYRRKSYSSKSDQKSDFSSLLVIPFLSSSFPGVSYLPLRFFLYSHLLISRLSYAPTVVLLHISKVTNMHFTRLIWLESVFRLDETMFRTGPRSTELSKQASEIKVENQRHAICVCISILIRLCFNSQISINMSMFMSSAQMPVSILRSDQFSFFPIHEIQKEGGIGMFNRQFHCIKW